MMKDSVIAYMRELSQSFKVAKKNVVLVKNHPMATIDNLRNGIIEKLLTISNKEYLSALYQLLQSNTAKNQDTIKLTEEQILMLKLSDQDIDAGKLISQNQLDKQDIAWLKGQ